MCGLGGRSPAQLESAREEALARGKLGGIERHKRAGDPAARVFVATLFLSGCILGGATTHLTKTTHAPPRQVVVSRVENATGENLLVKASLLSRLLSSEANAQISIPELLQKTLAAELRQAGVEVIEESNISETEAGASVAARIEGWEEASGPPYGKVVFLSASYRVIDRATGETQWEVRQERFPLRVEKMELDRTQAEYLLAVAVRDALKHWPK